MLTCLGLCAETLFWLKRRKSFFYFFAPLNLALIYWNLGWKYMILRCFGKVCNWFPTLIWLRRFWLWSVLLEYASFCRLHICMHSKLQLLLKCDCSKTGRFTTREMHVIRSACNLPVSTSIQAVSTSRTKPATVRNEAHKLRIISTSKCSPIYLR